MKDFKITINVGSIIGFLVCLVLINWGKDQVMKYIGIAGLIYLSKGGKHD